MSKLEERENRRKKSFVETIVETDTNEDQADQPTINKPKKPGRKSSAPSGEKLVQKAYYITEKQYKALKLQAAIGDEKDMSVIVRQALDAYLAETLKMVK